MFDSVALIGCGLIGSSFALALREAGITRTIVGFDRDIATRERARELKIVDRAASSVTEAARGATLVVVAVPVAASAEVFGAIATALDPHAIVTDVGSTKVDVVAAAGDALGAAVTRFVPGHPVAGGEVHGPDAASATLFRGKRVLLTPITDGAGTTDPRAVAAVEAGWTACGARVERLGPDVHDRLMSAVSHLPHLLAYALVAQIADADDAAAKLALAGGGFRDFTRIAASSPVMWRDIALANRAALLNDLDEYRTGLDRLREALSRADGPAIEALFERASRVRGGWRPVD